MPTYEYACSACGNAWEEVQKITEPALEECPACHKATAKRQISGGSFILKGGGWYADLYSSSKPSASKDSSSSSGESKSSGDSGSTSTESPAETKKTESTAAPAPSTAPAKAAS